MSKRTTRDDASMPRLRCTRSSNGCEPLRRRCKARSTSSAASCRTCWLVCSSTNRSGSASCTCPSRSLGLCEDMLPWLPVSSSVVLTGSVQHTTRITAFLTLVELAWLWPMPSIELVREMVGIVVTGTVLMRAPRARFDARAEPRTPPSDVPSWSCVYDTTYSMRAKNGNG